MDSARIAFRVYVKRGQEPSAAGSAPDPAARGRAPSAQLLCSRHEIAAAKSATSLWPNAESA